MCRQTRQGTWKLTMSFPRPGCSSREDSGGLLDCRRNNMCGRGSQRGILTGTVPCALNSVLRGDHCPAVLLPRGFRRPPRLREEQPVLPWQPKRDPDRHRPLCPQLSSSGRPLPCCGFGAWNLLGPNTNPNPTPNRDPPPKPKPASIPYPAFDPLSGMGPHFSARERSRDRGRFSPGDVPGPNPNPS